MELGKKIKELREKKKLTQEDLGLAVGAKKPRQWGSQIENGKIKNLKQEYATKLGLLLGVDPAYFYLEQDEASKDALLINPERLWKDPGTSGTTKKETIYLLEGENRALLRENAYLKSLLLKHKIDVYDTDSQNDTV